jgi:LysM domain/Transglycosylase SLT domain
MDRLPSLRRRSAPLPVPSVVTARRRHRVTEDVVAPQPRPEGRTARPRPIDPLLARFSAMAAVGLLVVPLSMGPVATAGPAVVQARHATDCANGTYKVVRGDSWIGIAKKVGVTTKQLLKANNATAKTLIHPGRTLCLPANAGTPVAAPAPAPAAATPPTTTAAPAPTRTYTAAEVEAIIREVWPDELEEEALRIAKRESNLKPTAKNWCCYGLFQIYFSVHKSWLAKIGVTSASQLLDPTVNANAAYTLYQRAGGFGPWQ